MTLLLTVNFHYFLLFILCQQEQELCSRTRQLSFCWLLLLWLQVWLLLPFLFIQSRNSRKNLVVFVTVSKLSHESSNQPVFGRTGCRLMLVFLFHNTAAAVLKTSGVSTAGGHQQNQQVQKKSSIGKIVSMYLSLIVLMLSSHNIYHVSILRQMRIYWFILHQSSPLEQKAQIIQKLRRKRVSTLTSGIWGLMNSPNTGFYVCTLWEVNFTSWLGK